MFTLLYKMPLNNCDFECLTTIALKKSWDFLDISLSRTHFIYTVEYSKIFCLGARVITWSHYMNHMQLFRLQCYVKVAMVLIVL